MEEDLFLQPAEFGRRIDTEFLPQRSAKAFEATQGVGRTSRPVQRQHQLPDRAFPQRVSVVKLLQLADQLSGLLTDYARAEDAILAGHRKHLDQAPGLALGPLETLLNLGLMLFGGTRLGNKMWLFDTTMVVGGATFSATWIVMANSWMQ